MKLKKLPYDLSVAKYDAIPEVSQGFYSLSAVEGEVSLVAESAQLPLGYIAREDGWRAFQVLGPLDFSIVGLLASLSSALAEKDIPIFAISTFDTDYILVKRSCFEAACEALTLKGYKLI